MSLTHLRNSALKPWFRMHFSWGTRWAYLRIGTHEWVWRGRDVLGAP